MRGDIESIDVALIELNGGTQSRSKLDEQTLEDYVQGWQLGATFPPIEVYFDGQKYWLADGFHRSESFKRAGKGRLIEAIVHQGTRRDAILHSVGANASHGLRRTNPDKRRAVLTLLKDEEWSRWSNQAIARKCGVDESLVRTLKSELSSVQPKMEEEKQLAKKCGVDVDELREAKSQLSSTPTRKATRGGNTYDIDTSAIGKSKQQSASGAETYIYKGTGAWGLLKNQKYFLEPNAKVVLANTSLTDPSQVFVRLVDQPESAIQVSQKDLKSQILDMAKVESATDMDLLIDCVGLDEMSQMFAEADPGLRKSIYKLFPGIYDIIETQLGEDIAVRLKEEDSSDTQSAESLASSYPFKIGDFVELVDPPDGSGWSPGDRVVINEIDYNTQTIYLKLDEYQVGKKFKSFSFDEIRLASKWKVGDRVQAPKFYQSRIFIVRQVYETGMIGVEDLEKSPSSGVPSFSFSSDDLCLAIDINADQSAQPTQIRNTFDALRDCFGDYETIREISDKDRLPNKPLYLSLRNGYEDWAGFICNCYWQGKIKEFVFNIPAQTHTSSWQEIADASTAICFTRERSVVLFYFGVNFEKFRAAFESLGLILKRHK
ncbi:MAG: hypothetical protein WBB28_27125 [Crinalium sp.]